MALRPRVFETRVYASSTTPAGRPDAVPERNGAEGDRTPDLHNAIVALSQLSYCPEGTLKLSKLARPLALCQLA